MKGCVWAQDFTSRFWTPQPTQLSLRHFLPFLLLLAGPGSYQLFSSCADYAVASRFPAPSVRDAVSVFTLRGGLSSHHSIIFILICREPSPPEHNLPSFAEDSFWSHPTPRKLGSLRNHTAVLLLKTKQNGIFDVKLIMDFFFEQYKPLWLHLHMNRWEDFGSGIFNEIRSA